MDIVVCLSVFLSVYLRCLLRSNLSKLVRLLSVNSTLTGTLLPPTPPPSPSAPLSGARSAWVATSDTDTGEKWRGGDHTKIKLREREGGKHGQKDRKSQTKVEKRGRNTSFAGFSTPS